MEYDEIIDLKTSGERKYLRRLLPLEGVEESKTYVIKGDLDNIVLDYNEEGKIILLLHRGPKLVEGESLGKYKIDKILVGTSDLSFKYVVKLQ